MTTIEQLAVQIAKSTQPRTSILHPAFPYVPAARTNIAETFARVRARLAEQAKPTNVQQIKRKERR